MKAEMAVKNKHTQNREVRDKVNKDLDDAAKRMKDEAAHELKKKQELIS